MKFINKEALKEFTKNLTDEELEKESQAVVGALIMQQAVLGSANASTEDLFNFAETIALMAALSDEVESR